MKRLIIVYLCLGAAYSAHAQFNAILYSLYPLTTDCDGGEPLGAHCTGVIFWDQNENGPDPADLPVPVGEEFGQANFNTFPINGEDILEIPGGFMTDPAFTIVTTTPQPSRYYIVVECGHARWTTDVITIENGLNEYEVGGWSCEEIVFPCDQPTYYFIEAVNGVLYWADGPHFTCIPVCANAPVQICYGPLGQDVIPNATVRSGCTHEAGDCDSACQSVPFTFSNNAWVYDELNSLWCNWIYPGETDGCVCLEDSFSVAIPPCDEPTYIFTETVNGVDYWADGPHSMCIPVCANAPVQICYGPLDQNVIPLAVVRSGCTLELGECDSACQPATFTFSNEAWVYDGLNSLWCNWIYPGDEDGCICLEDSFSVAIPPCDEPTYISFETVGGVDYWADGTHSTCISVCASAPVQVCYGPLGPDVIPSATVRSGCAHGDSGCNSDCTPATFSFDNYAWVYDDLNSLWCNWIYPGNTDGCICLQDTFRTNGPCDEPSYIFFEVNNGWDYWADGPHYTCLSLCADTPVQICYGPFDDGVFPTAIVLPGCSHDAGDCNTECPSGPFTYDNSAWMYDELNGYWCNWIYPGSLNCCVCLCDYFDFNIGFVESFFEAQPRDNAALIQWGTASESEIDYFRLLRDGQSVYTVGGTNNSTGSTYSFLDESVVNGRTYIYSLEVIDISGSIEAWNTVAEVTPLSSSAVITEYALHQNYPNPFNPSTNISYDVVETGPVALVVYNIAGQVVGKLVDGIQSAGRHTVSFDASNLTSGLYFYTVEIGNEFAATKKMQLVK